MRRHWLGIQLGTFIAIAGLLVIYVLYSIVGVTSVGKSIHVSVELPDAAGLFPHANVDYRGQQVGSVSDITLRKGGVTVNLLINGDQQIPADTKVTVALLSAVGEQYVDLRPDHDSGPYLQDGDVIPASRATLPLPVSTTLMDLENLVNSVNPKDLQIVVDELATAFRNTGPQLNRLVSSANDLVSQLQASQPQTVDLIGQAGVVLPTLANASAEFKAFSADIAQFSGQLKASDGDIRALLANGNAAIPVLDQLDKTIDPSLTALLGNLTTAGNILVARVPGLKEALIVLPLFGTRLAAIVRDGAVQGRVYIDSTNTSCGYGTPGSSPLDPVPKPPILDAHCSSSASDMLQRGAGNAPRPAGATTASSAGAPPALLVGSQSPDGSAQVTTYDPATGLTVTPDGRLVTLADGNAPAGLPGLPSWARLFDPTAG